MSEYNADGLRARRLDAGLTQRELAARTGIPQPNISAYEQGRRNPSEATIARLDEVLRIPSLELLRRLRGPILRAAEARGLSSVRVFGSVATGGAHAQSDVDLLVHPTEATSVFELAGFMAEVEELLGHQVDVVSDRGTGPAMDSIRSEAIPL